MSGGDYVVGDKVRSMYRCLFEPKDEDLVRDGRRVAFQGRLQKGCPTSRAIVALFPCHLGKVLVSEWGCFYYE